MPAKAVFRSGVLFDRRQFMGCVMAAAVRPAGTLAVMSAPTNYKVGPMPRLPSLPPRPHDYHSSQGFILFADGVMCSGPSSFCTALMLESIRHRGFARAIPYGLIIRSDYQKLWFLGRTTFAARLTMETMEAHGKDPWPGMDSTEIREWHGRV